jgi:hypothetical protein
MTFDVVKIDYTGSLTVMGELKTGANRWVSLDSGPLAVEKSLVSNGKVTAGGADWGATVMDLDDDFTWYVRVYPAVWGANPDAGVGRWVFHGCPYATIRRTKPMGAD